MLRPALWRLAWSDDLQRAPRLRPTALFLGAILSGVSFFPVSAQPPLNRSPAATANPQFPGDAEQARPTVESVSREAQEAIKACDDNVALQCVADALKRYAEALKQIAQTRAPRPPSMPPPRRHRCSAHGHDAPRCRPSSIWRR